MAMSERVGSIELRDALRNPDLLRGPALVVPRLAWEGRVTALGSAPKDGKSTLLGQAVAAKVRGDAFLGEPMQAGNVVWLALDESLADAVTRLDTFHAADGVTFFKERPDIDELKEKIAEKRAQLLVIDTLTEFVSGIVEDGNLQAGWQPILKDLRGIAQDTGCAIVLLDHTGKSNPNSLLGSTQKAAGVDVIVTMTCDGLKSNIRHFKAKGRVACSPFSLTWDGERNTLGNGELSLETRIYYAISAEPGISASGLRAKVGGKARLVDKTLEQLVSRGMVADARTTSPAGHITGHAYAVILPSDRTGGDREGTGSAPNAEKRVGQTGTGAGQGVGQGTLSPTLESGGGTGWLPGQPSEEEIERLAIEQEMAPEEAA
jgi:hypothetical protein